jgi:glucosyl-3-phosphoglycerate synthase
MAVTSPDLAALVDAKQASGTTITVCLPARNEEATVGQIVATVRRNLVEHAPLVDEVVVIDDGGG